MSTTRPRHKVDANQAEIADALFKAGYRVQTLAQVGAGCPDLLCSKDGKTWVLECKMAGEPLTPFQKRWHATWGAPVFVVHEAHEALEAVGT
jgi:hypothetical protein